MQVRDFKTVAELREAFPSAFLTNGTVDLSRKRGIRTLPRDMTVERHLILVNIFLALKDEDFSG
ncbi:hypothetical protein CSR02_12765 [Acetobacter pomorum]|uniref:Uncharacterized protein n=1 Tax=Acetobacter pomorum TaxID=65959 RepID=A0A2G4RBM0_9PROT|nr:hypothetical protein [Acetobacter pomorum]PHY93155.1 hypothetical protein CSR02_12765 [Acetobacter pomorum]GBR54230.1 hypothetical protein AA11825_2627 [Acetobacter pomorum DSM 11825]